MAARNITLVYESTSLPMPVSVFILEHTGTCCTSKVSCVELVHGESIHCLAKMNGLTAVWTRTISLRPLIHAMLAHQLRAILTLDWVLHDAHADWACEILVDSCHCIIGRQMFIFLHRSLNLSLKLFYIVRVWNELLVVLGLLGLYHFQKSLGELLIL